MIYVLLFICFSKITLRRGYEFVGFVLLKKVKFDKKSAFGKELNGHICLQECEKLDISFHLLIGTAVDVLPGFIKEKQIGGIVTDFSPLRLPAKWVSDVKETIPKDVPFCQV